MLIVDLANLQKISDTKIFLPKFHKTNLPYDMIGHNQIIVEPWIINPENLQPFLFLILIFFNLFYLSHTMIIGKWLATSGKESIAN